MNSMTRRMPATVARAVPATDLWWPPPPGVDPLGPVAISSRLTPNRAGLRLQAATGVPHALAAGMKREAGAPADSSVEQGRRCPRNGKRSQARLCATVLSTGRRRVRMNPPSQARRPAYREVHGIAVGDAARQAELSPSFISCHQFKAGLVQTVAVHLARLRLLSDKSPAVMRPYCLSTTQGTGARS